MFGNENIVQIIIKRTIILALILIGIILITIKEPKPYVLGLIFGTSVGLLSFLLMGKSVEKSVYMEPSKAYSYTLRQYFSRWLIYGIVLVIAVLADYLSFLTVAIGLLLGKTTIIFLAISDYLKEKFK